MPRGEGINNLEVNSAHDTAAALGAIVAGISGESGSCCCCLRLGGDSDGDGAGALARLARRWADKDSPSDGNDRIITAIGSIVAVGAVVVIRAGVVVAIRTRLVVVAVPLLIVGPGIGWSWTG